MKYYRHTQHSLGQAIGVTKGYVSVIMADKEPMSTKVLNGLIKSFPELNIHWLLTGIGEMLVVKNCQIEEGNPRTLDDLEAQYKSDPLAGLRDLIERVDELERWREELDGRLNESLNKD